MQKTIYQGKHWPAAMKNRRTRQQQQQQITGIKQHLQPAECDEIRAC
jgi:hypothetical protein